MEPLNNAYLIVAMRKLLEDETWAPEPICDLIRQHNGYPGEFNQNLEQYAPVHVWMHSNMKSKVEPLFYGVQSV